MPFILDSTRETLAHLAMQHAGSIGFNPTGIAGFNVVKRTERREKRSFQKPYAALIFQGRKRTRVGDIEHVYGPGDVVVTCIDFPSFTTIEEASIEKPFLPRLRMTRQDSLFSSRAARRTLRRTSCAFLSSLMLPGKFPFLPRSSFASCTRAFSSDLRAPGFAASVPTERTHIRLQRRFQ